MQKLALVQLMAMSVLACVALAFGLVTMLHV